LLARERPLFDGAEPAGSSLALMNMARLAAFTDDERWRRACERSLAFYLPFMRQRPLAMTEALLAMDFLAGPVHEIVIALPNPNEVAELPLRRIMGQTFCPRKALVTGVQSSNHWSRLKSRIPWLAHKISQSGKATAYVCSSGQCQLPATEPEVFLQQLKA
jgi:uncharacterized protein YyaL (SSP411 family)